MDGWFALVQNEMTTHKIISKTVFFMKIQDKKLHYWQILCAEFKIHVLPCFHCNVTEIVAVLKITNAEHMR